MDDIFEDISEDSSDVDGRSVGETAEESALYSLVHHSEDTYETGMLELSDYHVHKRNKAFRWDSVTRITGCPSEESCITSQSVNDQNINYISLNSNIASMSRYAPGKVHYRGRNGFKDQWNFRRNNNPWNVEDRDHYSRNRNLVPIHIENSWRRPGGNFALFNSQNMHRNNASEVTFHNSNLNSNSNTAIPKIAAGTAFANDLNKRESVLEHVNQTGDKLNIDVTNKQNVHIVSNKQLTSKCSGESHEVLIISDSDESIVEVSIPPKPTPPVIPLESSDESDSIIVSTSQPVLNITEINKPVTCDFTSEDQIGNENVECAVTAMSNASSETPSGSVKEKEKKNRTRKRDKFRKSSECVHNWTAGMKQFYNNSWGGEEYDHMKLQRQMTNNPTKWKILDIDRFGPMRGGLTRVRCANCNQPGHLVKQCPEPKKIKLCSMCGQQGHTQYVCPNKICFKCGRPAKVFNDGCQACWKNDHPKSCSVCGSRDHYQWICPDEWRKFHSTTTEQQMVLLGLNDPQYKVDGDLACCHCAGRGHSDAKCPSLHKQSRPGISDPGVNIFNTVNILMSKKRKKKRYSYYHGKNEQDFNRKRRKTN